MLRNRLLGTIDRCVYGKGGDPVCCGIRIQLLLLSYKLAHARKEKRCGGIRYR